MPLKQENVESWLSKPRFERYLNRCEDNFPPALAYYEANVAICQSLYNTLEALEVCLRNKIHQALSSHFGTEEWYDALLSNEKFAGLQSKVLDAKETLRRRKEPVIPGKIIAEFMLGFWVQMFNTEYQMELWKPLRNVFPNLPKEEKQRHVVSNALNRARNLRNRIFHYEPVFWNPAALVKNYQNLVIILKWMDPGLNDWVNSRCKFEDVLNTHIKRLKELEVKKLEISIS
jgi:hypothetical protein